MMADGDRVGVAPGGPWNLLRSPMLGSLDKVQLASVLSRIDRLDPSELASVTAREWVEHVCSRQGARKVLHALIRLSTYSNHPDVLSAEVAVMQLQLALGAGVIYLDGGWQQLVEALAHLPGIHFEHTDHVADIPDVACVIIATGSPRAAEHLLGVQFAVGPCADVAVLDVGLSRPSRHGFVLGIDPPMYLSDHGGPEGMAPPGASLLAVAEYLAAGTEPSRGRLETFLAHAGIDDETIVTERYLHRMPAVSAIATAETGGLGGRPPASIGERRGVFVVGDWVGSRGHLLDAVLASAEDAALGAIAHLDRRPVMR
jgi:hypothetical protein